MGALPALIIELFALCFKKLKTKRETKTRIIVLSVFGGIVLLITIIMLAVAETSNDKGIAFLPITFYLMLFGWRLIADLVRYFRGNFDETDKPNSEEEILPLKNIDNNKK